MIAAGAPTELAWRAWPLRRHPFRGLLAVVLVVGTCYGAWDFTRDPWITVLAIVVLAIAVAPFFVPTEYRLSMGGVEIRRPWRTLHREWKRYRGVRSNANLVVLSPLGRSSWLDGVRGETLFFEGNRGEVLEYVERMVGKDPPNEG
jgi:hypothetical protein